MNCASSRKLRRGTRRCCRFRFARRPRIFRARMQPTPSPLLSLQEGRFARLEAIEWWNQSLLSGAKVLVIGAGALGNEVIKNLALLGVGHLVVADMDRVELSNLSRSVLFREEDEG